MPANRRVRWTEEGRRRQTKVADDSDLRQVMYDLSGRLTDEEAMTVKVEDYVYLSTARPYGNPRGHRGGR